MGEKKKEARALFKNRISAAKERRREIEAAKTKTRSWRGGERVLRTCLHVRRFPDLPGGEISIEGSRLLKHCTTATKKSPRIKMGWKKKEERALFKNRISAAAERRRGNRSSQKKT